MEDDISKFKAHFQIPKSAIKKIRKEYEQAVDLAHEQEKKIDPALLKNYEEMSDRVLDFFSEISGRKVHRALMRAHLYYYFEEGFDVLEMIQYLKSQKSEVWYAENPSRYTIAHLFPIKDQERIIRVWDLLAFEQSRLNIAEDKRAEKFGEVLARNKDCGHKMFISEIEKDAPCVECLNGKGAEWQCMIRPYECLPLIPGARNDLSEICMHFMRHEQESLTDYAKRTYEWRRAIHLKYGKKIGSVESLTGVLSAVNQ